MNPPEFRIGRRLLAIAAIGLASWLFSSVPSSASFIISGDLAGQVCSPCELAVSPATQALKAILKYIMLEWRISDPGSYASLGDFVWWALKRIVVIVIAFTFLPSLAEEKKLRPNQRRQWVPAAIALFSPLAGLIAIGGMSALIAASKSSKA